MESETEETTCVIQRIERQTKIFLTCVEIEDTIGSNYLHKIIEMQSRVASCEPEKTTHSQTYHEQESIRVYLRCQDNIGIWIWFDKLLSCPILKLNDFFAN
jgi:hypothetical protein